MSSFYWSLFSVDLSVSYDAELLQEVIVLWVTIHGYSQLAAWMEQFKRAAQQFTKKTKSLHKTIRQVP